MTSKSPPIKRSNKSIGTFSLKVIFLKYFINSIKSKMIKRKVIAKRNTIPIPPKYAEFFSNTKSIGKNIKSNIEKIEPIIILFLILLFLYSVNLSPLYLVIVSIYKVKVVSHTNINIRYILDIILDTNSFIL